MADVIFVGKFLASKVGKAGLADVTVDVDSYTIAGGVGAAEVTAGAATERRNGLYFYRLAGATLDTKVYTATFKTADATVDAKEADALGIVVPDALVSAAVTLAATQGAVTFGQVKIAANVSGEGALDLRNSNANGFGMYTQGGNYGQKNYGSNGGLRNEGVYYGQSNHGATGLHNSGTAPVEGVDEAGIRTALGMAAADLDTQLDAVAKTGADGDTLETLSDQIDAVKVDTAAIFEDTGTTLPGLFAASGATVTVINTVSGGTITVYVGDTWSFTVTDSTLDLSGYETVALVVKRSARQADANALLYLRSDTGLQRIGGAAPVSAANGTLTKTATSFTALVALAETGGLVDAGGQYTWWLKVFDTTPAPDTGFTLATGAFVLERAGLAAVV